MQSIYIKICIILFFVINYFGPLVTCIDRLIKSKLLSVEDQDFSIRSMDMAFARMFSLMTLNTSF